MSMRSCRAQLARRGSSLAVAALLALALPEGARAQPACTVPALAAPGVPGVTVLQAVLVPAPGRSPDCAVVAAVATSGFGAPDGSALVALNLPSIWNRKFLFFGTGGLAGILSPAVNPPDFFQALDRGYATAITDAGHQAGNTDARWALQADGSPDDAKLTDYFFRAVHQVTEAAKAFVAAYYGAGIQRAYFDGCSNGGRMALVEASRFPEDYDGIIAGAPFFDIRVVMGGTHFEKTQLRSDGAGYIPVSLLPGVDRAILAACDAADGVADGLIQNPAACAIDPAALACAGGSRCLTDEQAETLRTYFTAIRDSGGRVLYTGAAVGDLDAFGGLDLWGIGFVPPIDFNANEPWGNLGFSPAPITWQFVDHIMKYIVERNPGFDIRDFPVDAAGVVSDEGLALFDARTSAGDASDPEAFRAFLQQGRKLLIYHGLSDPALPAFRTVLLYEAMARSLGGMNQLTDGARLFLVPNMQHCLGGSGPNVFDTLSALEGWVEKGVAPEVIPAAHFKGNVVANGVDRTMPLCKFPTQATFDGEGDVNSALSWSCRPNGKLRRLGPNGIQAGLAGGAGDRDEVADGPSRR